MGTDCFNILLIIYENNICKTILPQYKSRSIYFRENSPNSFNLSQDFKLIAAIVFHLWHELFSFIVIN